MTERELIVKTINGLRKPFTAKHVISKLRKKVSSRKEVYDVIEEMKHSNKLSFVQLADNTWGFKII